MRREIVLTFRETRDAIAAEKALADAGLPVRVMSRPSALGEGCGICLRLDVDRRQSAVAALCDAGIICEALYLKEVLNGKSSYCRM